MDEHIKLIVDLEESGEEAWHGTKTEALWARPIKGDGFEIDNIPLFVYGLSYRDVVRAESDGDRWWVREVVESRGHSTVRLLLAEESDREFKRWWPRLDDKSCTFEGMQALMLYSVDIPPNASWKSVSRILDEGEKAGVWDWELGKLAHPDS